MSMLTGGDADAQSTVEAREGEGSCGQSVAWLQLFLKPIFLSLHQTTQFPSQKWTLTQAGPIRILPYYFFFSFSLRLWIWWRRWLAIRSDV